MSFELYVAETQPEVEEMLQSTHYREGFLHRACDTLSKGINEQVVRAISAAHS